MKGAFLGGCSIIEIAIFVLKGGLWESQQQQTASA